MKLRGARFIRSNPERKWDVKRGWVTTEKLRGEYNALAAFAVQQLGRFSSIQLSPEENGSGTLTLTLDAPDTTSGPKDPTPEGEPDKDTENWELHGNDLQKDIWSLKRIKDLNNEDYTWLRQNVKVAKEKGTWAAIDAAIQNVELRKMFRLFMEGVEHYSVAQYVLRRNITTNGNALGSFVTAGANIQYTTQQIIDQFKVPNGIRFTLPQGAWIMRTPTTTFDGAKWQNSVEFWHADEWNEVLYPKFNTPEATELPPIQIPPSQQVKPPVITSLTVSPGFILNEGAPATFAASATGFSPIQFAWYAGQRFLGLGASLTVPAALDMNNGVTLIATNAGGRAQQTGYLQIIPNGS
jgi:hypothetical protein